MTPPVDPDSSRYQRQRVLAGFGADAQRRLAESHVLVIGAGGLGSSILPVLAAAGVGTLTIVDDDTVDASNLHRQTLHGVDDVGRAKVDSAADSLAAISPETTIVRHPERFAVGSTFELLLDADIVVDASDNTATRYLANDAATIRGIPLVWGSALGYSGQVGVAWDEAGVDYRDLVPEQPDAIDDSCETVGVLPAVCGVIGSMMATEVLKLLTGVGEPLVGRVQSYDALTGRVREIAYRRDPDAPRPGSIEELTAERDEVDVPQLTAFELAAALARPNPPRLIDVREPWEAEFASIPGSELMPLGDLAEHIGALDPDEPLVVYCHHGMRSGKALQVLDQLGFTAAKHLTGGIDAWAARVDPSMPRY